MSGRVRAPYVEPFCNMRKLGLLVLGLSLAVSAAGVAPAASVHRRLESREGDNTIYMRWNASKKRIARASSSRRLVAGQEVELLTSVSDRTGKIEMRAVLKNMSDSVVYEVDGRLVHQVSDSEGVEKTLRSRILDRLLRPGEKIIVFFSYMLRTGDYAVRTDMAAT